MNDVETPMVLMRFFENRHQDHTFCGVTLDFVMAEGFESGSWVAVFGHCVFAQVLLEMCFERASWL